MQCLNDTSSLYIPYHDRFDGFNPTTGHATKLFYDFMTKMREGQDQCFYKPDRVLKYVRRVEDSFWADEQHDAHEFLNSLLCLMDDEATNNKNINTVISCELMAGAKRGAMSHPSITTQFK